MQHLTTRSGRITATVAYTAAEGDLRHIPIGPCLVESQGGPTIDVIWGDQGQSSAALPMADVRDAQIHGRLVLLD